MIVLSEHYVVDPMGVRLDLVSECGGMGFDRRPICFPRLRNGGAVGEGRGGKVEIKIPGTYHAIATAGVSLRRLSELL